MENGASVFLLAFFSSCNIILLQNRIFALKKLTEKEKIAMIVEEKVEKRLYRE